MAKKAEEPPKYPEIGARLTQFIQESKEPSARQFAIRAGLAPQIISNLCGGHSMPSGETLVALASAYKGFDAMWLLTGKDSASRDGRNLTPIEDRPQPDPPADAVAMSAESHPDPYKHKYDALLDLVNKGFFGSPEQLLKGLSKKSRASAIAADLFSTADAIAAEYAGRLAALPTLVPFRPSPILRKMVGYGR